MFTEQQEKALRKAAVKLNVLVVDDSEFDRQYLTAALKKLGFRKVQIAENGALAMMKISNALAVEKPFDIVFVDWRMPAHDGLSLVKWIRSNPKMKSVHIFLTTGTLESQDVVDFSEQGADSFILKPITLEVLRDKVFALFSKRGRNAA